jgi:hypothetical protein
MAMAFGISALITAIRANLRGAPTICVVVLCFEIWLILLWILRQQKVKDSPQITGRQRF